MRQVVTVLLTVALLTGCGGGSGADEPKATAAATKTAPPAELPSPCTIVTNDDLREALELDYLGQLYGDRGCQFSPAGRPAEREDVIIFVRFDRLTEGGPTFADRRKAETTELNTQNVTEPNDLGDEAWINVGELTGLDAAQSRAGARVGDIAIRVGLDQSRDVISEKDLRTMTKLVLALAAFRALPYDESA